MYNIRDFGAVGDGTSLDTGPIQAALDACSHAGGEVYAPAGRYLVGTLELRSGTTLNLSGGATLLGSPRIEDYTRDPRGRHGDQTGHHLLRIADCERVRVTGGCTIDGQGPAFWDEIGRAHV